MRSLSIFLFSLLLVCWASHSLVQAEDESSSSLSSMASPPPLSSSLSNSLSSSASRSEESSEESSGEESSQQRIRRSGIRRYGNGKVTIISNNNRLVHIEQPKQRRSPQELEEQDRKSSREASVKREAENQAAANNERQAKQEVAERERRERETEQRSKQQQQEDNEKKAQETRSKQEMEERQKNEDKQKQQQKQQQEAGEKERQRKAEEEKQKREGTDADVQIEGGARNYYSGYQTARVGRWRGFVFVTGLLATEGGHMITLPDKYRPRGGRLIFNVIKGNVDCRVDVLEDGRIFHIAGGGSSWLALDGIFYPRRQHSSIQLIGGWVDYGYGYRPTTQHKQGDLCMLSGLIRAGGWGYFGRMNSDCFPDQRLIFSANNHASIARVDMLSNGYFVYVAGSANHGWINLDGISFTVNPGNYLSLYNGWSNYGNGYRPASYSKIGRVCSVSGLIRSDSWHGHITTLPEGCRPGGRLIFGGNVHIKSARIDVLENGAVVYVTGKAHWEWLSLDGIKFIAQR